MPGTMPKALLADSRTQLHSLDPLDCLELPHSGLDVLWLEARQPLFLSPRHVLTAALHDHLENLVASTQKPQALQPALQPALQQAPKLCTSPEPPASELLWHR